uniref:Uncharacterized protein n=1 Tax=Cacopsylla melanoneura TaxID=428564 RepID=A0A8D8UB57_9HEMI
MLNYQRPVPRVNLLWKWCRSESLGHLKVFCVIARPGRRCLILRMGLTEQERCLRKGTGQGIWASLLCVGLGFLSLEREVRLLASHSIRCLGRGPTNISSATSGD